MLAKTTYILQGIELRDAARKRHDEKMIEVYESKMTQIIDGMNTDELRDLALTLDELKIVDFGYPQKIITPLPHPLKFWENLTIFKRK